MFCSWLRHDWIQHGRLLTQDFSCHYRQTVAGPRITWRLLHSPAWSPRKGWIKQLWAATASQLYQYTTASQLHQYTTAYLSILPLMGIWASPEAIINMLPWTCPLVCICMHFLGLGFCIFNHHNCWQGFLNWLYQFTFPVAACERFWWLHPPQ